MKLGIVGLPNVGKSTLFNAITNAGAESANYPFCTIEPNVGMVSVPDERLDALAKMYEPEKFTPAVIEFVDIAGLVKGASKGEGLGNKFLANIREVDAIVHVVRCFEDPNIIHVDGEIGPKRDIETINLELIFSDIDILERKIDRTSKLAKGDKKYLSEVEFLKSLKEFMEEGKSARSYPFTEEEKEMMADTPLLSNKPIIYACNMSEKKTSPLELSKTALSKRCEKSPVKNMLVFYRSAQNSKKKFLTWTQKIKTCFWEIWDCTNPDWIALSKSAILCWD